MELFAGHHGVRNLIDPDRIGGDYISVVCIVVAMDENADSLDLKTISSAILVKGSSLGLKRIPGEKTVTSKFCSTGVRECIIQSRVEYEHCLCIPKRGGKTTYRFKGVVSIGSFPIAEEEEGRYRCI